MSRATNWKPLLGPADKDAPEKRTKLGIRYKPQGFDVLHEKRLEKTKNWMVKRHVPTATIDAFLTYACDLPSHMSAWIDSGFLRMKELYIGCGGKWAETARNIKPDSFLVLVEPVPLWSEYWNTYAAGLCEADAKTLHVVCAAINGIMTAPKEASYLRRLDDLARFEIGNAFSIRAGVKIKKGADGKPIGELGDMSPCKPQSRAALTEQTYRGGFILP